MSESDANAYAAPIANGDCQSCGAELPDIARFCLQCGAARAGTRTWKTTAFIVVVTVLLLLILAVHVFVVPAIMPLIASLGMSLPVPTLFVIDGYWICVSYITVIAASLIAWRLRPGSTGRAVAAWSAIIAGVLFLVGGILALYLPFRRTF